MLIHSCIFMILAIYIERINPGAFGISQPWNYLCKMGYWKSRRSYITQKNNVSNNNNKDDFITIENNHWVESNSFSNTKAPILSIDNVTKVTDTIILKLYSVIFNFNSLNFRNLENYRLFRIYHSTCTLVKSVLYLDTMVQAKQRLHLFLLVRILFKFVCLIPYNRFTKRV